ncbi:hypothetical protein LTR62_002078 [Meristemomyces frigidus]|uniref:Uncharacterized protein n=1 Tax=Meristemomyces frigidus TaxID=1508187 RepID=A0AAN7YQE0_9PEZI|nr:hypothetical protein LTR62_002078 [Meristemomyces frigidus]
MEITILLATALYCLATTAAPLDAPKPDLIPRQYPNMSTAITALPYSYLTAPTGLPLPYSYIYPTGGYAMPQNGSNPTSHPTGTATTPSGSTHPRNPTNTITGPTSYPTAPATASLATNCSDLPNGSLICNGTTKYGLCNFGAVVFQPVANGTQCLNGTITAKGDTTCSPVGALVCNPDDELKFGICNVGETLVWQPVAPGTACRSGLIGYA